MAQPMRARQGELRCALPGFPVRLWGAVGEPDYFMGALPIYDGPEPSDEPLENHEDGCPGAWYRCRFVASLVRFERPSTEHGGYSENLHLSRCDDPLVLDAIQYLEHERARALHHMREAMQA